VLDEIDAMDGMKAYVSDDGLEAIAASAMDLPREKMLGFVIGSRGGAEPLDV
jgi:hypothetical protein